MNFAEALRLHRTVAVFSSQTAEVNAKICIFDVQSEICGFQRGCGNYAICVKAEQANDRLAGFLKETAENLNTNFSFFRGYFILSSPEV
jgi:hypothetical protein